MIKYISTFAEFTNIATRATLARYDEMDQATRTAFTEWLHELAYYELNGANGETANSMIDDFEEAYAGYFETIRDFVEDIAQDTFGLNLADFRCVAPYLDYDKIEHDLFIDDYACIADPTRDDGMGYFIYRRY